MKILVIDDEVNIADGVCNILRNQTEFTCRVEKAYNSSDAIKIAKTFLPDLIISDIVMQNMNGLDMIKKMKDLNICRFFIILSGYDKFPYAQEALRQGVYDYLLKPIDKLRLIEQCSAIYHSLPQAYTCKKNRILPNLAYFDWHLDESTFPSSLIKVLNYLRKNYMKDINLNMIGEELFLHPNYISKIVNQNMGKSFPDVLEHLRICKAAELLLYEENMSISEISYLVGYNYETRLYKAFNKCLNCTPADFRKKYHASSKLEE
jgi:two-component system, response regulator YesN